MSLVAQMAEDLRRAEPRVDGRAENVRIGPNSSAEPAAELPLFAAADQIQVEQQKRSRSLLGLLGLAAIAISGVVGYVVWQPSAEPVTATADSGVALAVTRERDPEADTPNTKVAGTTEGQTVRNATVSGALATRETSAESKVSEKPLEQALLANTTSQIDQRPVASNTSVADTVSSKEPAPVTPIVARQAVAKPAQPAIKQLPRKSADQQLFETATAKLRERQVASAVQLLQSTLTSLPQPEYLRYKQSASLYASLLIDQQNYSRAAAFISAYNQQVADSPAMAIQAIRLAIAQQQYGSAQQQLDRQQQLVGQSQELMALQAALYQQQQNWQQAALVYRQLLNIDEYRADYWMGMAVAYDAMQVSGAAKTAYQQAIALGKLKPSLQRYALTRVASL